jgi:hypothetical protein
VSSSITLYESSLSGKTPSEAIHLQDEAYDQLQLGLQPAALAAGDNGQWQALMTTISESSRVPERVLVSALQLDHHVTQLAVGHSRVDRHQHESGAEHPDAGDHRVDSPRCAP